MVVYESADIYIETATDLCDRINKIQEVIDALYSSALKAASKGDVTEYQLDDGQSKIKTVKADSAAISRSILAFQKIKHGLINDLNGRAFRLMDGKSIRRF